MDLLMLVVGLVVIGFLVYLLTVYVPMPAPWARAIQVPVFIVLLVYLLTHLVRLPNVLH